MFFRILGPLVVESSQGAVNIPGRRERKILATLLLEANSTVSIARLIDVVWGHTPPRTAREQVQNCAGSLIHLLHRSSGTVRIVRGDGTYSILINRDDVDANVFRTAIDRARHLQSAGREPEAKKVLAGALRLWRGDALADVLTAGLQAHAAQLEELRMRGIERYADIALRTGDAGSAITELTAAIARYPFNERLREQLMRALRDTGRPADALSLFQETRTQMVRELGLEPGAGLQRIQQEILTGSVNRPGFDGVDRGAVVVDMPGVAKRHSSQRPPDVEATTLIREASRLLDTALRMLAHGERGDACRTCATRAARASA